MSKRNQHVVPHNEGWAVRTAGRSKASSVHETQCAAIDKAREMARNSRSDMLVHGRDGRIRERSTYGDDPFPPKG